MSEHSALFDPRNVSKACFNAGARPNPAPFPSGHPLSMAAVGEAERIITKLPGFGPTPLVGLDRAAEQAGLGSIMYKDESRRFHLKNFKVLGGAYAVLKLVDKVGKDIVVTSSTAGSHGRSIAWGAKMAGARCVIYIGEGVSDGREKAMADLGAEVVRVKGAYDESFRAAIDASKQDRWYMVCDTTFEGYNDIPLDIMQGYGVMVNEIREQLTDHNLALDDLTHVFLQAGCGGFAAAIMAGFLNQCEKRPKFVLVEPEKAACVLKSFEAGKPVFVEGDISTVMGGLEVAEVSMAAWPIFTEFADAVLAIRDEAVAPAMTALANGALGGAPIEAGESAPAGLIAALAAAANPELREQLGLGENSKVLVFGTEGAADPATFVRLTGIKPFVGI